MGVFARLAKGSIAPDPGHPGLEPLALANADGSLYVNTEVDLPSRCIDGRRPITPYAKIVPCMPGGSLSLLVGLAATRGITDSLWGADELSNRLAWYGAEGSIHAGPDDRSSGCGALDGLTSIITYANEQEDLVREVAFELGLPIKNSYPLGGLRGEKIDAAGVYKLFDDKPDTTLHPLRGVHSEIAIVVNHKKGTTIDQNVLDRIGDVDVFDVDAWSIDVAAEWLADNYEVDRDRAASAMSAFTVATLAILAQPSIKVLQNRPSS